MKVVWDEKARLSFLETLEYWVVRNGSMRYSDKLFNKVMEAEYEISLGRATVFCAIL